MDLYFGKDVKLVRTEKVGKPATST